MVLENKIFISILQNVSFQNQMSCLYALNSSLHVKVFELLRTQIVSVRMLKIFVDI